ncbi:hypothetical protein, partial [Enterococcus faecalis]|uniref:hypothetical protein n=1 Tax=Enterococcus faecalis TaxID=1351 RepID=UPI003D6A08AC
CTKQEYEKEVYQSDVYRSQVVQDILVNWKKTSSGPLIAGVRKENTFQALLAVSGKQGLVNYYNILKEEAAHLILT